MNNLASKINNRTDYPFALFIIIIVASMLIFIRYQYVSDNLSNIMSISMAASFSLITTTIVYESYKLNRNNHRLSLFDKRYKVYSALIRLLASTTRYDSLSKELLSDFSEKRIEAKFLFESDILEYLGEIERKMNDFKYHQAKENAKEVNSENAREVHSEKAELLFNYFAKELLECDNRFMKYLSFKEI